MVKVILGSFGAFPILGKLVSRKGLVVERNSEIWTSGVSIQFIQGTFDSQVVKSFWGHFGAFLIFGKLVCRKWLVVERNRVNLGLEGDYSVYTGYFSQLKNRQKKKKQLPGSFRHSG